jgi:hypothetical protein
MKLPCRRFHLNGSCESNKIISKERVDAFELVAFLHNQELLHIDHHVVEVDYGASV